MNVSGHRISTTEVESALVSHPSVAEAAVGTGGGGGGISRDELLALLQET